MNTFSSNKNFRFDNNIKNCFRIQKQNYVPQENEDDKNKSSNNNFSGSSSSSYDMKNSIFVDEEIIFTENKIYISATERNLKQCKSNNKVDKKPFDVRNVGNYCNQFNSISLPPINGNGKCSGKLGFDYSLRANEQIVFEKVKYDKNKKYLQPPSPSNSSEHSTISYELNQYFGSSSSRSTQTNRLSTYDNIDYEWAGNDENGNSSSNRNELNSSIKGHQQKQTTINDNQNELYLKNSDSWKFFNKQYLQNSKFFDNHKIIKNNTIHYECVSDSRRTSVSTCDTWVDDESFDNSFNEELEKRCTAQMTNVNR